MEIELVGFLVHAKSVDNKDLHAVMLVPYRDCSEIELRREIIAILMANNYRLISAELIKEES